MLWLVILTFFQEGDKSYFNSSTTELPDKQRLQNPCKTCFNTDEHSLPIILIIHPTDETDKRHQGCGITESLQTFPASGSGISSCRAPVEGRFYAGFKPEIRPQYNSEPPEFNKDDHFQPGENHQAETDEEKGVVVVRAGNAAYVDPEQPGEQTQRQEDGGHE